MTMNLSKVAASKKTQSKYVINMIRVTKKIIKISYDRVKDGHVETYTMVSAEKPRPELYTCMNNLAAPVAGLLEIEKRVLDLRIRPVEVRFKYNGVGLMSAVIESEFRIPLAKANVMIKTPEKQEPVDPEIDMAEDRFFVPYTVEALRAVQAEAIQFIDGERAQTTLFNKNDGNKSE